MTFGELLTMSMNSPELSLRWTAIGVVLQIIQTLIIIVSGMAVFWQVRQIRIDAIEKKISGLQAAVEALDNDAFNMVSKEGWTGKPVRGLNWRRLLSSINLVALLVKEKFTNLDLLLAMRGKDLYAVAEYIKKNGLPEELKNDLDDQFKPAIKFLDELSKSAKKLGYID